ncbi:MULTISPECIES: diguanylate cyclase [unclassified Saccharopolyspora]|uniref:GGDEF domain-containing protein n=1 Tax=unclassified Saccharopolyspora TaxID=2646250 RepID=UPI001CD763A8|nr:MULTISPECIES: tetratricopeptide repeat-containing diguanylate cyclase [unclassified Saccharopolyspora]MCA1189142.1 diguanylate cyclase [Saccharopolyspora sp. 6T]MCA1191882.1 diguanylate cyclase [Saccharopolyspora sp. 6V]MCA1283676.1 diguanylate cyclase [Saccharopolyspora sp. 7B]
MSGHIPAQDRRVRALLDSGHFHDADVAFDELVSTGTNLVGEQWNRATVLVHRAWLSWRLNRIPQALELAAEGWTDLDADQPSGASAAQTISILGNLLETIGHRESALELMSLSVQVARKAGDPETLAHCLVRQASALIFRSVAREVSAAERLFGTARDLFDEALLLVGEGQLRRLSLAGGARALAGLGRLPEAERLAQRALELSKEAEDGFCTAVANWVLAVVRRDQGDLHSARTFASRALDSAESIGDTMQMMRYSLDLASVCVQLGDAVGEAAALRRTVRAGSAAVETLQEGLGQALEQRRVAVQAQRLATAAQEAAVRDPLTGLVNRLGLQRQAPELLAETAAQGRIPWLVLLDVDWFKDVNDYAGHAAGDATLQEVAHLLRRECRADDLICRWAGDEFVVLLVDDAEDSRHAGPVVAERIRSAVDRHDWRLVLGCTRRVPTVSIGVAGGPAKLDHLFAAADIALYRAKRAGRNRVETDHGDPEQDRPEIRGG